MKNGSITMESYGLVQYMDAGCPEVLDTIGILLYKETNGKICTTGCGRFKEGKCEHYRKLVNADKPKVHPSLTISDETVKQKAARLGVSLSEVRRQNREK